MENPRPTCGRSMTNSLSLDLGHASKVADLSALERKERTARTLANRVLLAAKRAPVLFAVEDAHWIDPSTNEFLRDIVLRIHGAPVYVLMTHRPDWSPDWGARPPPRD